VQQRAQQQVQMQQRMLLLLDQPRAAPIPHVAHPQARQEDPVFLSPLDSHFAGEQAASAVLPRRANRPDAPQLSDLYVGVGPHALPFGARAPAQASRPVTGRPPNVLRRA
jgi:hypothetical protein